MEQTREETAAALLARDEALQQADREQLRATSDPAARAVIQRRIAGREGLLATRRRHLAEITGEGTTETRDRVVRVRLTETEYIRLQQAADTAGQTVGQYIRDRAL